MDTYSATDTTLGVDHEGMPTGVFRHTDGSWGFRADATGGRKKRRQIKRVGFNSMAAARNARTAFAAGKLGTGRIETITVSEWFDEHLVVVTETRRGTTAANYKFAFDRINNYIGDVVLSELDEATIRSMYRKMATKYKTATLQTDHGRLRAALRAAVREGRTTRCAADNVTPPPGLPTRKRRTWDFRQLQTFTRAISTERDAAMWTTWVTTGVRRGEICGLRWSKLDLDAREMIVDWQRTVTAQGAIVEGPTKTRKGSRTVPVVAQAGALLREWRAYQAAQRLSLGDAWAGQDFVFTTREGKPYAPSSFDDRLACLADRADLPRLSPHELRHTFATRSLESDMPLKVLSEMLGHTKVETTQNLYLHVSPAMAHEEADAVASRMFG
jgi:integrase